MNNAKTLNKEEVKKFLENISLRIKIPIHDKSRNKFTSLDYNLPILIGPIQPKTLLMNCRI